MHSKHATHNAQQYPSTFIFISTVYKRTTSIPFLSPFHCDQRYIGIKSKAVLLKPAHSKTSKQCRCSVSTLTVIALSVFGCHQNAVFFLYPDPRGNIITSVTYL